MRITYMELKNIGPFEHQAFDFNPVKSGDKDILMWKRKRISHSSIRSGRRYSQAAPLMAMNFRISVGSWP